MKKIFTTMAVALATFFTAQAQEGLSIKGGLSVNVISMSEEVTFGGRTEEIRYGAGFKIGFHLGVGYEVPFSKKFSFETGLVLDTRGFEKGEEHYYVGTYRNLTCNLYGLTIPALVKGRIEVGNDINLFANVGPYFNYLISGKEKGDISNGYTSREVSRTIEFDENEKVFNKRVNFGFHFGGGVEFKNFIVGIGNDLGLTDFTKDETVKTKLYSLKLSVGYKF